jgi:hypothetical protein
MTWLLIALAVGRLIYEAWERQQAEAYVEELRQRGEL